MLSTKFKIFCFVILASSFGLALVLLLKKPDNSANNSSFDFKLHYANRPETQINNISIRAVYFAPKDQQAQQPNIWQQPLTQALKNTSDFYQKQLGVKIEFQLYPKNVTGENNAIYYDSQETAAGNPSAVNLIRDELQKRLFDRGGDLYDRNYGFAPGSYNVLAVLYEGVGGGGTMDLAPNNISGQTSLPTFLLARNFLTEENYQDYGESFFAHEFGHTLGLVDNYDTKTGQPFSDDLMGSGRYRPLDYTYLLEKDKASLGAKP